MGIGTPKSHSRTARPMAFSSLLVHWCEQGTEETWGPRLFRNLLCGLFGSLRMTVRPRLVGMGFCFRD